MPVNKEMSQTKVGIHMGSLPLFGAGLGEGIKLDNHHIYLVSQDFEFVPDLAVWACPYYYPSIAKTNKYMTTII